MLNKYLGTTLKLANHRLSRENSWYTAIEIVRAQSGPEKRFLENLAAKLKQLK